MGFFHSPTFPGLVIVGIIFNIVLGIFGLLGFALLDALWITASLLTIVGAALVQHMIETRQRE